MYIAVLRETMAGERRVALVPDAVQQLVGMGHHVGVAAGAGEAAQHSDAAYRAAGADIHEDVGELLSHAHVVLGIRPPAAEVQTVLRPGTVLIGLMGPLVNPQSMALLAQRGLVTFSLDALPRISRAQSMDVLSAMSTVSGYRAVIMAAQLVERFLPMLMTSAGTIAPARFVVLGAGVAGLQAVATAHRLGAVVQAFDARPVVKEQVESLGATFLALPDIQAEGTGGYARAVAADEEERERQFLAGPVKAADVVITTAMVPGSRAPLLISEEMVASMHAGAVIMDLAAEAGGNCAATVPGQRVRAHGVIVDGATDLPSQMANPSSQLYSRNVLNFLRLLIDQGLQAADDAEAPTLPGDGDEIVRATTITRDGEVVHAGTRQRLESAMAAVAPQAAAPQGEGGRV